MVNSRARVGTVSIRVDAQWNRKMNRYGNALLGSAASVVERCFVAGGPFYKHLSSPSQGESA